MSITKEIKCLKCLSFIHTTSSCYIKRENIFCGTDNVFKVGCTCLTCKNRCPQCNYVLDRHDHQYFCDRIEARCEECNEFLWKSSHHDYKECIWDHKAPFCQYCNLPLDKDGSCYNMHQGSNVICSECGMTEYEKHIHDGKKCKICNSLLNQGKCIFKCVNGGTFCIHCNYEGVVNDICLFCKKDNNSNTNGLSWQN